MFGLAASQDDEVKNIKRVLEVLLRGRAGPTTPRPKFTTVSIQQDENKRELLYTLMGEGLAQPGFMHRLLLVSCLFSSKPVWVRVRPDVYVRQQQHQQQ